MSDANPFFPTGPAGGTTPGSYVVPLARARFIFKAQFFHPIKESDQPLPLHHFYLFCVSGTAPPVLGEPSQGDGTSWLNYTLDGSEDIPGTTWALAWRPLFPRPDGSYVPTPDVGNGEAWLDLDAMTWVAFKDIALIDKRKLLRVPLWASFMKAKEGGFKESPSGTAFGATGLLDYDKKGLAPYGDPKKPWVIQVDQGLFRSYVRFVYYDLKDKVEKPVPPGLVVQTMGARTLSGPPAGNTSRLAGGTALDDDGTVYLLHERTEKSLQKSKFNFLFLTGTSGSSDHGLIEFSKPGARDKVSVVSRDPSAKRDERYLLPREWHSFGMQGWTTKDGSGLPQRKEFLALATTATTRSAPLHFHLDDAVLASTAFDPVTVKKDSQLTLFDHLMTLREPDAKKPHFWKTKLPRNYLAAEQAVFVASEGVEKVTRVVFHEGVVYELREGRLQAKDGQAFGKTPCLGARSALTNAYDAKHQRVSYLGGNPSMPDYLRQVKGRSVQHLIDVSDDVTHQVAGVDVKLLHLISWVPVFFENQMGAAGKGTFDDSVKLMTKAAERWDQAHPGHPAEPPADRKPAEFVLAPVEVDGVVKAGMKIVRVRHFFAEVPSTLSGTMATSPFADAVKIVIAKSADPKARAGANSTTHTVTLFQGDIGPKVDQRCVEPGQDVYTTRFTLAHEMGHILGFPDEYIEGHPTLGWRYAAWNQYSIDDAYARPFGTDRPGMMNNNNKPRLRNYWHYANSITGEGAFAPLVDAKPYFPINLSLVSGGALVHERPACDLLPPAASGYQPVSAGITVGRCDATLYRLGVDEGIVERMFKKAKSDVGTAMAEHARFDGFFIVRIKFMVQFESRQFVKENFRTTALDALQKLGIAAPTTGIFNSVGDLFSTQFVVEPDPPKPSVKRDTSKPQLRRVFIGFFPEMDVTNRYTDVTPPAVASTPPTDSHVFIELVRTRATPHPLLLPTPPSPLPLLPTELDASLLRYALGRPTFKEDPITRVKTLLTTLSADDVQFIADLLKATLGDGPTGARKAKTT